ncbi:glycoside hydrolase family 30 beta sandwich domain-containing protein [Lacihabitans sp. CS3-21]|uniref:glycoside hydrolase family 30 beta sandwich domain-containing protein n=1 Tax=Lacihabitans sp. CS3-21 TaxID=2487332 RepID=UPI0020CC2758|nr:glycoside hydrolase family 30 beta sandwich domain-containing protein [Lacihabitans sp. CS3-21]MCP9746408.1 hypothetical protein [Lacihabitans sp. CS3-21]
MKIQRLLFIMFFFLGCKSQEISNVNLSPVVTLESKLISVYPMTYEFSAKVLDQEFDDVKLFWDFGNGIKRFGDEKETEAFSDGQIYSVKVIASDGISNESEKIISISTEVQEIEINPSITFQTIEGFGGFGAQNVYWSNGPFTSERFVSDIVNDLGCTIIRDEVPTSFEIINDNDNPYIIDLKKFNLSKNIEGHHQPLAVRLQHFKAMHEAGINKFIASVWSPAPWMKWNNDIDNGTPNNSAPEFNSKPDTKTNQLKEEFYEEFAESLVAYCKIFKSEIGIDLYALSIQNEPRFSQFYSSCVYNGEAYKEVLIVVGKRFKKEGLKTLIFGPEDVGWFEAADNLIKPSIIDTESRQYIDAIATHGYAFDGITSVSNDALTWRKMKDWGNPFKKPLWMTETSGFKNTYDGAIDLAKAMYMSLTYGNVSAWVFWTLSTENIDEYSLMNSKGEKSKRFYVSKQFYKYIRPGAVRIESTSSPDVLSVAFSNNGQSTVVLINISSFDRAVKIKGGAEKYRVINTNSFENALEVKGVTKDQLFVVQSMGVTTLFSGEY